MVTNFAVTNAPIAVLALLGAAGLTCLLIAVAGFQALRGRRPVARRIGAWALAVPLLYAVVLVALAGASRDVTVPPGGEKHFCEIDCHVAYALTAVESPAELDGRPPVNGRYLVVALRSRFDPETVGPRRGNAQLFPNPRALRLVDRTGRRYAPPAEGAADLASERGAQPPLTQPLRPGESYVTRIVFDVPADAAGLRLLIVESDWPTRLLLGHETSPLHGKSYLALPGI